jgi:hypothetical protein
MQGMGLARWLVPGLRKHPLVFWAVSAWLGLVASVLVLMNLYILIPLISAGVLVWPAMLGLVAGSLALFVWKRPRGLQPRAAMDVESWVIVAVVGIALLLLLRPLIGHTHFGFYFSNNGEFGNYAALGDIAQFHDASTTFVGPYNLHSREVVVGLLSVEIGVWFGQATLWIVEPLAAALAVMSFIFVGLLFRYVALKLQVRRSTAAILALIYVWAIASAASQLFWTLSFMSQYLSIAIWFGVVVFIIEGQPRRLIRIAVVGGAAGSLICAYPEMFVPCFGLLATLLLACTAASWRARAATMVDIGGIAVTAAVVANALGYALLVQFGGVGTSGWNIYGAHHPVLPYVGNLVGLTSPFFGRPAPWFPWSTSLVCVLFAAGCLHAAVQAWRTSDAGLRGLLHLGWIFFVALAAVFFIVAHRGNGNNYIALKLIFQFGWLAYLGIGIALARLLHWRPKLLPAVGVIVVVLALDLARSGRDFSHAFVTDSKEALFLASDAAELRAQLDPSRPLYTVPSPFPIAGQFVIYDHDMLSATGHWPAQLTHAFTPGGLILLLGRDAKLDDDKTVTGAYHRAWRAHSLALYDVVSSRLLRHN